MTDTIRYGAGLLALAALGLAVLPHAGAEEPVRRLPPPALDEPAAGPTETAVFSGGCFWGVQGVFEHVKGVQSAVAGYAGGPASAADYETVSTGTTGHAESVEIRFDPRQISYGRLLQIFFSVVLDPTEKDFQGPDQGPQYRSEIWTANAAQAQVAHAYIAALDRAHVFASPIATRVDPLAGFYKAEGYHQDYLTLHPSQPYIATFDLPKVAALRHFFPENYKAEPTLVGAGEAG